MEQTNISPELTAFLEALAAMRAIEAVINDPEQPYLHIAVAEAIDRARRARWALWRQMPPLMGQSHDTVTVDDGTY